MEKFTPPVPETHRVRGEPSKHSVLSVVTAVTEGSMGTVGKSEESQARLQCFLEEVA